MTTTPFPRTVCAAIATLCMVAAPRPAHAAFDISVTFSTAVSDSQRAAFTAAEQTWESLLSGYLTPTANAVVTTLAISAAIQPIDGVGAILGAAGPSSFFNDGVYELATAGEMEFDSADVANLETNGRFNAVILHEMAHVMGFGTLWTDNGVYANGTGQYTGLSALATYRTEYNQPLATFVPVELGGGAGTRNAHWAEVNPNTANIFDGQGRSLTQELMTGFLGANSYISCMTVEQFRDIGYLPALVVVPEAGTAALLSLGLAAVTTMVRRRRAIRR